MGGRLIFSRVAQSSTYQQHHPPTNQCTNKSYIQGNNKYRNKLRFTQLVITSSVTNNNKYRLMALMDTGYGLCDSLPLAAIKVVSCEWEPKASEGRNTG